MPYPLKLKQYLIGISVFLVFILQPGCQSEDEEPPFLFGKGTGIGNVTLMVNDLPAVIKYYRDTLGFNIRGDGEAGIFEESVSNGISFGDMTYFEILSLSDSADQNAVPAFITEFLSQKEGIRLFSINTSSVDSTYLSLTSRGIRLDSARSHRSNTAPAEGWSRDNGGPEMKSLDFDRNNPSIYKPRFVEYTGFSYDELQDEWNTYYTYGRMYSGHANGVVGISAVKILVNDLDAAATEYENMGLELIEKDTERARYRLFRHQELQLVSAKNADLSTGSGAANSNGVYAIQFDVLNLDSTYQYLENELPDSALTKTPDRLIVDSRYAYGVQLEFVREPEEQALLARKLMPSKELDTLAQLHASELYEKYCALCHGENREGYAADHAPSLQSKSLLGTSMNNNFMRYTIQFGRANTAMAGYLDTQGGPLEFVEIELLLEYLQQMADVEEPIEVSRDPVYGDIELGSRLYSEHCATCHGEKGEGVTAPALANPMLLATATDHFLRYAIANGRDGTPMEAFKDQLSDDEIDGITAFLRSRASGWDIPTLDSV
ncbi:MAG: c-type cytochrome, partial [Cyclobacteriaceae bacterium]